MIASEDSSKAAVPAVDPRFEPMLTDALTELLRARETLKTKWNGSGYGIWRVALEMVGELDLAADGALTVAEIAEFALKISDFEHAHEDVLDRAYQEGASPPRVHEIAVPSADTIAADPVRICRSCKVLPTHAQFDGPCAACDGELCAEDCAAKGGMP